jgi:hypothetical protein
MTWDEWNRKEQQEWKEAFEGVLLIFFIFPFLIISWWDVFRWFMGWITYSQLWFARFFT